MAGTNAGFNAAKFREGIGFAWLVGILEGEGSFSQSERGVSEVAARVCVGMTDEDVILKVAEIAGCGRVYGPYTVGESNVGAGPFKDRYQWVVQGAAAVDFMRECLPHMGERRSERIREILKVQDQIRESRTLEAKVRNRIKVDGDCWIWTGKMANDVPYLWHERKLNARTATCLVEGVERPGRYLTPECGESLCVHPAHLTSARKVA